MKRLFSDIPRLQSETLLLRQLFPSDAADLRKMTLQTNVYRFLPTFLFEKKYDAVEAIDRMYDECLEDSLIIGVFRQDRFCGLAEVYGYQAAIRKVSVGYRLLEEMWGQGIATEALRLMTEELLNNRGIKMITASTMIGNFASAHVLMKNAFTQVKHAVNEDWGYPEPTPSDKWIRLEFGSSRHLMKKKTG